jgi:two-component system, cell cycle sensor histidine kinase and response regulator CckA
MSTLRRFHDLPIRFKLLSGHICILITAAALGSLILYGVVKNAIETRIESELHNTNATILKMVEVSAAISIKNSLRAVAEKNREIAWHFWRQHQAGSLSRREAIARIRGVFLGQIIGKTGYVYCIDSQGMAVVHPREAVEGENWSSHAFVRDQIRKKEGYLEYAWKNPGEAVARKKLVFYTYLPEFQWIVASSGYLDEFYGPIRTARSIILTTVILALILVVPLTLWMSASITRPLKTLMGRLSSSSEGDFSLRVVPDNNDEIGQLAGYFNSFMARLETYSAALRDEIQERKQAESALREAEAELRALLNNLPDIAWLRDTENRFLIANRQFSDFFGASLSELRGLNDSDLWPPDLVAKNRQDEEAILGRGRTLRVEEPLTDTGGHEAWFETIKGPFFDNQGRVIGVVGISRDITERKRTEKQMLQVQKMEAIGTLAGGIAHDFNNLLGGILGNVNLLQMDFESAHPIQSRLRTVEKIALSGSNLSRQMLAFARGGKYEVRPTDLNRLVENTLEMFTRTRRQIAVRRNFDPDIWQVSCDRAQIEQVLLNLWVNAADAMPAGGELYLETTNVMLAEKVRRPYSVRPGPYVLISVRDTGHGMDRQIRSRVFEPFFTTKEMGKGTGLGLASAYGIVKNHDGLIDVSSRPGQGTVFKVYLPAKEGLVAEEVFPEPLMTRGSGSILLVDDEPDIRKVARDMLEAMGYGVYTAGDGNAALELYRAKQNQIDMVILDIVMPGMNGAQVFDRLMAMDPEINVLLSSGYSRDGQASEILSRGGRGFIQKPFRMNEFSRRVSELMARTGTGGPSGAGHPGASGHVGVKVE